MRHAEGGQNAAKARRVARGRAELRPRRACRASDRARRAFVRWPSGRSGRRGWSCGLRRRYNVSRRRGRCGVRGGPVDTGERRVEFIAKKSLPVREGADVWREGCRRARRDKRAGFRVRPRSPRAPRRLPAPRSARLALAARWAPRAPLPRPPRSSRSSFFPTTSCALHAPRGA